MDSPAEQRGFEPLVPRGENGWPVLTTLIDPKALLLSENQTTFSREGPTIRILFAPATRQWRTPVRNCDHSWVLITEFDGRPRDDLFGTTYRSHLERNTRNRPRVHLENLT
jgi:hypothetical protein